MSLKRSVLALPFHLARGVERILRGRRNAATEKPAHVLVLEYMLPLGCCVHLTPLYEALRAGGCSSITVATRGIGASILRHHPFIDHLIETPDPLKHLCSAARTLSGELERRGIEIDCVLTGVADQRSRIALLGLLACGGWRGGFTQAPQLYSRPLSVDRGLSHIGNNLRLAGLAGCDASHREPRVFFSPADVAHAEALAREANPAGAPLLVVITQTSGGQRTGWHPERFAQVIRHAHSVLGCAIAYVGTQDDSASIDKLRIRVECIGTSLAGRTTVTELAALLAMSDYAVSLDTGTMHVARAVGVPMVVIGPSWQRPLEWLPLGLPQVRILRGPDRDDIPPDYRLDEVTAEEAISALEDLFAVYPPSAMDRTGRLARHTSAVHHLHPAG